MADYKSSEGKRMSVIYYCIDCNHEYREITFDKKEYKEVLVCPHCKGKAVDKWKVSKYAGGAGFAHSKDFTVETQLDINGTIKGLKAIQREARKATAALKELDNIQKHTCPECKAISLEIETLTADNKISIQHKRCTDCGWTE